MVMIEWHMVILKYDTCRKRHIHTQRYKWRKDIPVFLTGVRAIESDDDWQWVSVLSECDRTDTSAADCLQHIALFYVLLQYMMYRQSYWHVFYNFVSFECNWSFFFITCNSIYRQQVSQIAATICACAYTCMWTPVLLEIWFILVAFNTFIGWTTALKMLLSSHII